MTELDSEAMEAEFGTVAAWTEQAVRRLGPEYAVPAGCRGSGSEGALAWLADRMRLEPGSRVLDDGAGVGGPAGWLAGGRGIRPVCAEPMADAAGAAHRMFGLPALVAAAQALPFADGAFDAAWCLGVLCTTAEKAAALAELRRVLIEGGRLGLLVFLADGALTLPVPDGNSFPTEREMRELLGEAGFSLQATAEADLGDSPPEWQERSDAVDRAVAAVHGGDDRWQEAQEQSGRVGRLLAAGQLRAWLAVAVRDTGVP